MLNRVYYFLILSMLLIPVGGQLHADEKIVTGKFVVSFIAEGKQKTWVVNALEQNIYNDLSGYTKVVPFEKSANEDKACKNRNVNCLLELYKKLNVDGVMLGWVDESEIDYETYDVQKKALVGTGSIGIGSGSSLLKLRLAAFNAFKPFIAQGGILDKRKYNAITDAVATGTKGKLIQNDSIEKIKEQFFIGFLVLTLFPYLLSILGKSRRHPERSKIIFRWFHPFHIVSLSIIGYLYLLETNDGDSVFNILSLFAGYEWILTGFGGAVWGYFLIKNIKIIIPYLQGIERVQPNILVPLFQSLFLTVFIKAAIVAFFYIWFFYGIFYIGNIFLIDRELIILLLYPFSGLYILYWIALMLEVFSMTMDVKLCGDDLDYKNVWDLKIRKYTIAHLKRNGTILDKQFVDDVVFLAAKNKGVICYGGGFSRPRIAIDKEMIKFCLGDVDDFNPQETIVYTRKVFDDPLRQNSLFKIMANISEEYKSKKLFKSRFDKKRIGYIKAVQKIFERDLTKTLNRRLERETNLMKGRVLPRLYSSDDQLSLMSDDAMDMAIVEALLLENTGDNYHFDPDAEVDDSNEQDKDFLFGAILHKYGGLLRHEDVFTTIYYYFRFKKAVKSPPYNFFFSKNFAVVADTFVVINFGLNHLMQYLHYQATNVSTYLTIKGVPSTMLESQDAILINAQKVASERKPKLIRTDELERIVWLSRFCQGSIELQQGIKSRAKKLVKWIFIFGIIYLASIVLIESYKYYPTYLDIIETEKQEIADAIKKAKEKERKEK